MEFSFSLAENLSGGFNKGPLRAMLFVKRCKWSGHQVIQLNYLTETSAKKRKFLLKGLRVWLDFGCGYSWDSGSGIARK
jgi:hypothetical protein